MFDAFPTRLNYDVSVVLSAMSKKTINDIPSEQSEEVCTYTLLDGQKITFPYRIYYLDECPAFSSFTFEQRMIYHCIHSRSHNGFIREKHIRAMIREGCPDWMLPYIIKISDEYVVEILEVIYNELKGKNTDHIKAFCSLNFRSFEYGYKRMVSYWNEFYRNQVFAYNDYIGKKLFTECYGYKRSMGRNYDSIQKELKS